MTCVLAAELFEWYPHSDLLPVEPPEPDETIREYRSRVSHVPGKAGDSIFDYLLSELTDNDREEVIEYMDSTIGDLATIRTKLVATSARQTTQQ